MNIADLKQKIINEPSLIEDILEKLGVFKIRELPTEFRGAKYQDSNPTGLCVKKDNLYYFYRGRDGNQEGDIISLVENFKNINFTDAVKLICEVASVEFDGYSKSEKIVMLPFNGYFKGMKNDEIQELKTYSEEILNKYINASSIRFARDGISYQTQREFGIYYDMESERIITPWRNSMGQIIGLMGRYNGDDFEEKNISKWMPIHGYNFPKSQVLYGYSENYHYIIRDRRVVLVESEKGVLQMRSMYKNPIFTEDGEYQEYDRYNIGLGVGSHAVSETQKKLISTLYPNVIIVAFDEDVDENYLIETCKKLQFKNGFNNPKICYIKDVENKYIPKGSKLAPTDLGKEMFEKLLEECCYLVE